MATPPIQEEKLHSVEAKLRQKLLISAHKAEEKRKEEDGKLRRQAARNLLRMFLVANAVTMFALIAAWVTDNVLNASTANYLEHRIFDRNVMIALLTATTVQLGAAAIIIANWFFPKDRPPLGE